MGEALVRFVILALYHRLSEAHSLEALQLRERSVELAAQVSFVTQQAL
jgi:hypothetical protein